MVVFGNINTRRLCARVPPYVLCALGSNVRNVRCNAGPPRGVITRVVTRAPTRTLHRTFDPYRTARTRAVPSDDKKGTSTEIFKGNFP